MAQDAGMDQTVSRAVRDNLVALERVREELNQAMADLVAACSSTRPANALSAMLRAQTAAASLAASLEVMSRFVANTGAVVMVAGEAAAAPAPRVPATGSAAVTSAEDGGREMASEGGASIPAVRVPVVSPPPIAEPPAVPPEPAISAVARVDAEKPAFDVSKLSGEEQELHRRANRVAKVSMQDIKMLRPDDIKTGREKKDLCQRLRVDLDKARKEYDRRFKSILAHPVDYFYDWLVDIIADGDPKALGDYPYPTSAPRR
jgi:hypothetical protein